MEVELKYGLQDPRIMEQIWHSSEVEEALEGERHEETLQARYFDTEDHRLLQEKMAFRIRREGEGYVACLKWRGRVEGALHSREEVSVPVDGFTPDLGAFRDSSAGRILQDVAGELPLTLLMEAEVRRRHCLLRLEESLVELALDRGVLRAGGREAPLLELELELMEGERESLLRLGSAWEAAYGLVPEEQSKFQRGLALAGLLP